MTHNSKRNRRHTTVQDGDDYVYPTKKIRETKTRSRRSDRSLIKKGLVDLENSSYDEFEEESEDDAWYDDTPMASDEEIAAEMEDHDDKRNRVIFFEYFQDFNGMDF